MSIQRVSDLQVKHITEESREQSSFVKIVEEAYLGNSTELNNSLLEVSWNTNPTKQHGSMRPTGNDAEFRSDSMTFEALSTICVHPLKNMDFDFYNTKTFHNDVFFDHGLSVSVNNRNITGIECGPIMESPTLIGHPETVTPDWSTASSTDLTRIPAPGTDKQIVNVEYLFNEINNIWNIIDGIFPLGSIYITTSQTYVEEEKVCPLDIRAPNGRYGYWELIEGYYLLASGNLAGKTYKANDTIDNPALPNITGRIDFSKARVNAALPKDVEKNAFSVNYIWGGDGLSSYPVAGSGMNYCDLDASRSSNIYKNNFNSVQLKSYVVDVWRRTDREHPEYSIHADLQHDNGTVKCYVETSGCTVTATCTGGTVSKNQLSWRHSDENGTETVTFTITKGKSTKILTMQVTRSEGTYIKQDEQTANIQVLNSPVPLDAKNVSNLQVVVDNRPGQQLQEGHTLTIVNLENHQSKEFSYDNLKYSMDNQSLMWVGLGKSKNGYELRTNQTEQWWLHLKFVWKQDSQYSKVQWSAKMVK